MEKNRLNLILYVANELSAAPEGAAKADLVEELSDNLYQRYTDFTAAGMPEEEALQKAREELGDVEELVEYLKGLEPDQPLPREKTAASQMDDVLQDVEEICRAAMDKAKSALREARETMEESGICNWSWRSEDGEVEVTVTDHDACPGEEEEPEEHRERAQTHTHVPVSGRDLSAEVGKAMKEAVRAAKAAIRSDAVQDALRTTKEMVKDAVHTVKDTVRGKGGSAAEGEPGPDELERGLEQLDSEDGEVEKVDADALRGIDVQVSGGDVTIRATRPADGDVLVGGDVEDLEVTRREDGVLVIRQGKTASASFLFGRGVGSADVVLDLPCRDWGRLNIATGGGDVELDLEGVGMEEVCIHTGAGDVHGQLPYTARLMIRAASGDVDWHGNTGELWCESASGTVEFYGVADVAKARSVSGDVRLEGSFPVVQCSSISGDVCVATQVLPDQLDVSSTSGDCRVSIPDNGGFEVSFKTSSGKFTSDFFEGSMGGCRSSTFTYQGGGPIYQIKSVSGDLSLDRY